MVETEQNPSPEAGGRPVQEGKVSCLVLQSPARGVHPDHSSENSDAARRRFAGSLQQCVRLACWRQEVGGWSGCGKSTHHVQHTLAGSDRWLTPAAPSIAVNRFDAVGGHPSQSLGPPSPSRLTIPLGPDAQRRSCCPRQRGRYTPVSTPNQPKREATIRRMPLHHGTEAGA